MRFKLTSAMFSKFALLIHSHFTICFGFGILESRDSNKQPIYLHVSHEKWTKSDDKRHPVVSDEYLVYQLNLGILSYCSFC